jgi:hypothetical protein
MPRQRISYNVRDIAQQSRSFSLQCGASAVSLATISGASPTCRPQERAAKVPRRRRRGSRVTRTCHHVPIAAVAAAERETVQRQRTAENHLFLHRLRQLMRPSKRRRIVQRLMNVQMRMTAQKGRTARRLASCPDSSPVRSPSHPNQRIQTQQFECALQTHHRIRRNESADDIQS